MSHSFFAIEDLGDLFESGALGLDEDEIDPEEFNEIPTLQTQSVLANRRYKEAGGLEESRTYSVEDPEVIRLGQLGNGNVVGLSWKSEDGLHSHVHDQDTLGTEMVRKDFQGVGDEKTRKSNRIEDTEDPDEDNLGDTKGFRLALILVLGSHDGPEHEGQGHAYTEEYCQQRYIIACLYPIREYIPIDEVMKSGRRPTRSIKKAALIETIKLRRVLPIWS